MADHKDDIDSVSGTATTGHQWDDIKELNTPLPRWWVICFYLTIVWAVGYWLVYPAWPLLTSNTTGLLGYSSRADVAVELANLEKIRGDIARIRIHGFVAGAVLPLAVQQLVLEKYDRIPPLCRRRREQCTGVVAMASEHHRQARHGRQQVLRTLAVSRSVSAAPSRWCPDDERHLTVRKHARELHGVVVDLIHCQRHEIREHDLDDGVKPREREADGCADDAGFADRRRNDASAKIGRQARRHFERAPVRIVKVLAENDHVRTSFEQAPQRRVQRRAHVPRGSARCARRGR